MYTHIRKEARRQRTKLLRAANSCVSQNNPVDFYSLKNKIDPLAEFENLYSPEERIAKSLFPLLGVALILWSLWSLHLPDTSIKLNAKVSRMIVHPSSQDNLDMGKLGQVGGLRIEGLDRLDSDSKEIEFKAAAGSGSFYANGPAHVTNVELSGINTKNKNASTLNTNAQVVIAKKNRLGTLDIKDFRVNIQASIEDTTHIITSASGKTKEINLGDAMFSLHGPTIIPARVRIFFGLDNQPVEFPIMHPNNLVLRDTAFNTSGEPESFSSIEHGEITIVSTGQKYKLTRGTHLLLDNLNGLLQTTLGAEGLYISFHGTAGNIGLGTDHGHVIRDLRPSLAEWISSDRLIAMLWSGFLFISGGILSIRRLILWKV